jgi:hypothetical protein
MALLAQISWKDLLLFHQKGNILVEIILELFYQAGVEFIPGIKINRDRENGCAPLRRIGPDRVYARWNVAQWLGNSTYLSVGHPGEFTT